MCSPAAEEEEDEDDGMLVEGLLNYQDALKNSDKSMILG